MQLIATRPIATPPLISTFEVGRSILDKTESLWNGNLNVTDIRGSYTAQTKVTINYDQELSLAISLAVNPNATRRLRQKHFRAIAEQVRDEHSGIDINDRIKGIPVIKGNRVSVGQILGRLYVLGSIDAVVEFYRSTISKEQVKEAIAFAQDFLEAACEPI